MRQPIVSIIVPVYNVEPYVEDCIRSVMRQTYTGTMECIIVDDCGTDDSMGKVERLLAEYDGPITFQVLHHTRNRGLSAARNTGMDAAMGDYIFFLDSDDELADDCIDVMTEPLCNEWYDLVIGNLQFRGFDKNSSNLLLKLPDKTVLRGQDILNSYRIKWNMMAQNKLYKAEFIKTSNIVFLEGLIHEDELWSFQIACLASSLYSVKTETYISRIRQDGISGSSKQAVRIKHISTIVQEISKFAAEKKIYNERVHQILQGFFYYILKSCSNNRPIFVKHYRQLRSFLRPSLFLLVRTNGAHIICHVRDIHYYLPKSVAPYWILPFFKYVR